MTQLFKIFNSYRGNGKFNTLIRYVTYHTNWEAYVAFSCYIESERLLKVTGSRKNCKSGNIFVTVQTRDIYLITMRDKHEIILWLIEWHQYH